jgi:hypothetical protein
MTQNPAALTKNNGPFIDKFVKVMHPGRHQKRPAGWCDHESEGQY